MHVISLMSWDTSYLGLHAWLNANSSLSAYLRSQTTWHLKTKFCLLSGKISHEPFLFLCIFRSPRGISEPAKQCCHWNAFRKSGMQQVSMTSTSCMTCAMADEKSASQTERKRYVAASEICHIYDCRDFPINPSYFQWIFIWLVM